MNFLMGFIDKGYFIQKITLIGGNFYKYPFFFKNVANFGIAPLELVKMTSCACLQLLFHDLHEINYMR